MHGGFDSLIEEVYAIWERIAASGFDVVAFEGRGQGGARALSGLLFDHDWEKPVAAIMDYFALEQAAIVGLSRRFMNWSIRLRARLFPVLQHVVDHTLYLVNREEPMAVADWFLGMNANHLGSDRVTQDVLLCCGERDAFQPPVLTRRQAAALTAARSVQIRTFTTAEHADQHCQIDRSLVTHAGGVALGDGADSASPRSVRRPPLTIIDSYGSCPRPRR